VTPRLYNETDLPPLGTATNPALPTPIRQLQEIVAADNQNHPESPLAQARREIAFFGDLWHALTSGAWDAYAVPGTSQTLSLRALWVNGGVAGHEDEVFWFD